MGLVQSCSDGTSSTSLSTTKSTTKQLPWNLANAAKLLISNQLTIISHSNNNRITQRKKKQMVRFVGVVGKGTVSQLLSTEIKSSSLLNDGENAGVRSVTMMKVRPEEEEVGDHSDLVTMKSPSSSPPPPSRRRSQTARRFGFNSSYLSQSSKDELSRSDDDTSSTACGDRTIIRRGTGGNRNARRWYGSSNDNEIVTDNNMTSLHTIHSIEKSNHNASKRYPISIKIPFKTKSRVIQNQYDSSKTTSTSSESSVTSYSLSEDHPFSKEEELKQMYDLRTWDMYLRITAARRYQREQETQQQQELQRRREQQQQMDCTTTTNLHQQDCYQPQLAANFRQNQCDRNNITTAASHTQSDYSDNNRTNNTALTANPSTNIHQSYHYHDDEAMMMMCHNQYLNNSIHVENTATTATSTTTPFSANYYYYHNNLPLTPSHNNNNNNISNNNNLDYDHYDEHELIFGDIE